MPHGLTSEGKLLREKLLEVAREIAHIEKRGHNDHHGYDYVQARDVIVDVRGRLYDRGILVLPGTVPGSVLHFAETGGRGFTTTVDLLYRFMDTETGAFIEVPWTGAGSDVGGDKGLYKAFTGGLKYMLLTTFLIPMGDDPERDNVSEPDEKTSKDAERPQAPRIPLDRARTVAQGAIDAGLAHWERTDDGQMLLLTPVFRAKLLDVGAAEAKIGNLNVDQAETVERFIADEKAVAEEQRA